MIFEKRMAEIRNRVVLRGIESEVSQNQGANFQGPGNIPFPGKYSALMKKRILLIPAFLRVYQISRFLKSRAI